MKEQARTNVSLSGSVQPVTARFPPGPDTADSPRMTASIRNAIDDLHLSRVIVVHAGEARYPIAKNVEAIGAAEMLIDGFDP